MPNVSQGVLDIAGSSLGIPGPDFSADDFAKRADHLVQRDPTAAGDVEQLACNAGCRHRQDVCVHDVLHVREVPRLLSVPEDGWLPSFQCSHDEARTTAEYCDRGFWRGPKMLKYRSTTDSRPYTFENARQ